MKKFISISIIASSLLFLGCSSKNNDNEKEITFQGQVDLAPIYKMIVYTGSWDGNESKLPTNYTFTDENGKYKLTALENSSLHIQPISLTKVISTPEAKENPIAFGNSFLDTTFEATTSNPNAFIYASTPVMSILNQATSTELQTFYGVNSISQLQTEINNNNTTVIQMKEFRDIQNYVIKTLLASYISYKNNAELNKTVVNEIETALTSNILENNLSINDENDIKNLTLLTISTFNNNIESNYQIIGNYKTELANYSAIIIKPIVDSIMNETNTTKIQRLYGKVVDSEFTSQIKATAQSIESNLTKATDDEQNNILLYNAFIQNYMQ